MDMGTCAHHTISTRMGPIKSNQRLRRSDRQQLQGKLPTAAFFTGADGITKTSGDDISPCPSFLVSRSCFWRLFTMRTEVLQCGVKIVTLQLVMPKKLASHLKRGQWKLRGISLAIPWRNPKTVAIKGLMKSYQALITPFLIYFWLFGSFDGRQGISHVVLSNSFCKVFWLGFLSSSSPKRAKPCSNFKKWALTMASDTMIGLPTWRLKMRQK